MPFNRFSGARAFLLALLVALIAGCGSSTQDYVFTSGGGNPPTPTPTPPGPTTSTIIVTQQLLQRAVPSEVTQVRFSGTDASSTRVFGPVTEPKATRYQFTVSPTLTRFIIEYLREDTVIGIASIPVQLVAGETLIIDDPDFTDVLATLESLEVSPATLNLAVGSSGQLRATGRFSDDSTEDLTDLVSWSSQTPGVATVSNSSPTRGLAQAVAPGSSLVVASLPGSALSANATVNVSAVAPTLQSLVISPEQALSGRGAKRQYTATASYDNGTTLDVTDQVVWGSSSPDVTIASETAGNLTAGQAVVALAATGGQNVTVSATLDGIEATSELSINSFAYAYREQSPFGLEQFRIESDGALTSIGSLDFNPSDRPIAGLTVHPSGRFVYATTANPYPGYISLFLVDPTTGALTLSPTTYQAGVSPRAMATDPAGRFLYAANQLGDTVSTMAVNFSSGGLTRLSPPPILNGPPAVDEPASVAAHPNGRFLYTANRRSASVSLYGIDPETGELSDNGKLVVANANVVSSVAVDPSGTYLVLGTQNGNASRAISYRIQSDGSLIQIAAQPTGVGAFVIQVAFEPSGTFAFAVCGSGFVRAYKPQPNSLDIANGAELGPSTANGIAFDPSGRFAYISSLNGNAIHAFTMQTNGLSTTSTPYPSTAPSMLVTTP